MSTLIFCSTSIAVKGQPLQPVPRCLSAVAVRPVPPCSVNTTFSRYVVLGAWLWYFVPPCHREYYVVASHHSPLSPFTFAPSRQRNPLIHIGFLVLKMSRKKIMVKPFAWLLFQIKWRRQKRKRLNRGAFYLCFIFYWFSFIFSSLFIKLSYVLADFVL